MDTEPMDVLAVLDRPHKELLAEGWSQAGAKTYIDALAHVQGQIKREVAVLTSLNDLGLLWLVDEPEAIYA